MPDASSKAARFPEIRTVLAARASRHPLRPVEPGPIHQGRQRSAGCGRVQRALGLETRLLFLASGVLLEALTRGEGKAKTLVRPPRKNVNYFDSTALVLVCAAPAFTAVRCTASTVRLYGSDWRRCRYW